MTTEHFENIVQYRNNQHIKIINALVTSACRHKIKDGNTLIQIKYNKLD